MLVTRFLTTNRANASKFFARHIGGFQMRGKLLVKIYQPYFYSAIKFRCVSPRLIIKKAHFERRVKRGQQFINCLNSFQAVKCRARAFG